MRQHIRSAFTEALQYRASKRLSSLYTGGLCEVLTRIWNEFQGI